MQQTEKYKLNLIETSDTFSPDPLNENMQKVEAAIAAETAAGDAAEAAARKKADAALDARVKVLEKHEVLTGYADATGTVDLGATPKIVFAISSSGIGFAIGSRGVSGLKIVSGGFEHAGYSANCNYVAII